MTDEERLERSVTIIQDGMETQGIDPQRNCRPFPSGPLLRIFTQVRVERGKRVEEFRDVEFISALGSLRPDLVHPFTDFIKDGVFLNGLCF